MISQKMTIFATTKYSIMKTVVNSILYIFGIGENPISIQMYDDDFQSIKHDWENVGHDIHKAMTQYGETK